MKPPSRLRERVREQRRLKPTHSAEGMPPASEQIANAASAGFRFAKSALSGEQVLVSAEVAHKRRETCLKCDNRAAGRCKLCGCWTSLKIKLATEACPVGKWLAETTGQAVRDTNGTRTEHLSD